MSKIKLKPCPKCGEAWFYVSCGDYGSGYENLVVRVQCCCNYAWKAIGWQSTREQAADAWNRRVTE